MFGLYEIKKPKPPENWEDIPEFYESCTCNIYDWEFHTCPYSEEINEDYEECNCCPYCEDECAANI